MVAEGFDLVVAIGELADTALVSRRIGTTNRLLVAAPAYLAQVEEPTCPQDLASHECIIYPGEGATNSWSFTGPGGEETVPVHSRFRTNSSEVVCRAALDGMGLALLPEISVSAELQVGRLRRLLPGYIAAQFPIHILYPSRQNLPARTRLVIDFLVEEFQTNTELIPDEPGLSA
jgi:DNA-binding transcriptional LysR family regulator